MDPLAARIRAARLRIEGSNLLRRWEQLKARNDLHARASVPDEAASRVGIGPATDAPGTPSTSQETTR